MYGYRRAREEYFDFYTTLAWTSTEPTVHIAYLFFCFLFCPWCFFLQQTPLSLESHPPKSKDPVAYLGSGRLLLNLLLRCLVVQSPLTVLALYTIHLQAARGQHWQALPHWQALSLEIFMTSLETAEGTSRLVPAPAPNLPAVSSLPANLFFLLSCIFGFSFSSAASFTFHLTLHFGILSLFALGPLRSFVCCPSTKTRLEFH